jgi:hypothetical protein
MAVIDLDPTLSSRLAAPAREWLRAAQGRVPEAFAELPRRLGRGALGDSVLEADGIRVDLAALRLCDAGAHELLRRQPDSILTELFAHGDIDERTMAMRCAQLRPITATTVALLGEAQRTNLQPVFEALCCDSNLLARAFSDKETAGKETAGEAPRRALLKLAFLGLPLARALGAEALAHPELSRMLQDLATEREAAGRPVWPDTCRMIARAPAPGTLARLVGALEHGDDALRLAAAEGLALLARKDLAPFLRERLPREPKEQIKAAIERALSA